MAAGGIIFGFIMGTITGVFAMTGLAIGVIDEKRKENDYLKERLSEQADFIRNMKAGDL